jgi:hypothetical protein
MRLEQHGIKHEQMSQMPKHENLNMESILS